MRLFGRESWKTVTAYTIGIWVCMYLVFDLAIQAPLFGGIMELSW
jgi:hypothetical protein